MSSAIGMVMPSACGSSVTRIRETTSQEAPFAMSFSPCVMMGGISRTKVNTTQPDQQRRKDLPQHVPIEGPQHRSRAEDTT